MWKLGFKRVGSFFFFFFFYIENKNIDNFRKGIYKCCTVRIATEMGQR